MTALKRHQDVSGTSFLARLQKGAEPPPVARDTRRELSDELLRGTGLEVGALHLPMVVPSGVVVRYVDRMTVPELRAHYPELQDQDLVPVDVVDDGELLSTVEPESTDFIIANHFLEHCEDPIGTITSHLGKVRSGGVLFYAVPDKRYTFDFRRPPTPLSHAVADHEDGGHRSRADHYLEWARLVYPEDEGPPDEQTAIAIAADLDATRYSIHFHVWTQAEFLELMVYCQTRLGSFELEAVRRSGVENVVVLRKHGELVVRDGPVDVAAPLQTRIPDLERELAESRRDADRARAEAGVLDQRLKTGEQVLEDVFNSASWRLTMPLRAAKHAVVSRLGSRQ